MKSKITLWLFSAIAMVMGTAETPKAVRPMVQPVGLIPSGWKQTAQWSAPVYHGVEAWDIIPFSSLTNQSPPDFDGDGKTDVWWRHKMMGYNRIWFMNGAALKTALYTNTWPDFNWEIQ